MSILEFALLKERAEGWLDTLDRSLHRHPSADTKWSAELDAVRSRMQSDARLKLVIVGAFNAGKSSLVNALTGAEVQIDADVATTKSAPYDWRGITIIDTPGVHSERETIDHDAIAREETVGADLVLCVVTNELFSPRFQKHFHFLAESGGLGLSGKLAVVVNKMDREANADEVIVAEVDRAIAPFAETPVFLCSAKKLIDSRATKWAADDRERLEEASRFEVFTRELDQFVRTRGALGKLATPVQAGVALLEVAKEKLGEGDQLAGQRLQLIRRKRRILEKTQGGLQDVVATIASKVRIAVLKAADGVAKRVTADSTTEQIETDTNAAFEAVYPEIDEVLEKAQKELRELLSTTESELQDIDDSPLGIAVRNELAAHGKANLEGIESGPYRIAGKIKTGRGAVGNGLKKGLERMAKDPKALRDGVLKWGHKLGKKFRPWEAIKTGEKLAKVAGKVAKALPYLAAALDFYLAYREEKEEAARNQRLAESRLAIMRCFRDQADLEVLAARRACDEMLGTAIKETIQELDGEATAAVEGRAGNEVFLVDLDALLEAGRTLQAEILA